MRIQLFGFLILCNSLAPLVLMASDPTILVLFCEEVAQERAFTDASLAKLQIQVSKLSAPKQDIPPSPPSDDMVDRKQKLWDAIRELHASTCSQERPKEPHQPDPQVAALTAQVVTL
ncbi:hypothetical protein DSO57_1017855 [Entomophthora muscae]|uniref:Uncharacterized protein n=1 Tax=Entomophthora muscae TaxID=34485 RepID=A0ACC2ST70_9FUNG|nr:hypothetical protein DSO57_1017855 [Entomophthora muscae]